MEATGDGPINYAEWQKWIDWCKTNKISLITWSISAKVETCSMIKPGVSPLGNWKEADLNESGIKARELLRKQAE
jgi:endoglucanase